MKWSLKKSYTFLLVGMVCSVILLETLPLWSGANSPEAIWAKDEPLVRTFLIGLQLLRYMAAKSIIWIVWILLGLWLFRRLSRKERSHRRTAALALAFVIPATAVHMLATLGIFHLLPITSGGSFPVDFDRYRAIALLNMGTQSIGNAFVVTTLTLLAWASSIVQKREQRAAELERSTKEAHLLALRLQLEPHFLFNVLNSVVSMIRSEESKKSVHVLTGLSELLRETSRHDAPAHLTLAEELDFARRYLSLERLRFGERLQLEESCTEQALAAEVPARLLLPLVENCVKHGLSAREGNFTLQIEARLEDGQLHIWVRDNGPGIPSDTKQGTGWFNTQQRLLHNYGQRSEMTTGASNIGGAEIHIVLPADGRAAASELAT